MEFSKGNGEVSILRVFINSRTINSEDKSFGYSIDIQSNDVFVGAQIKNEVEKISLWSLKYAPELLAYKFIKERESVIEFKANQFASGIYKVKVYNAFEKYLPCDDEYEKSVNIISKEVIGRIIYLFSAYSLNSY